MHLHRLGLGLDDGRCLVKRRRGLPWDKVLHLVMGLRRRARRRRDDRMVVGSRRTGDTSVHLNLYARGSDSKRRRCDGVQQRVWCRRRGLLLARENGRRVSLCLIKIIKRNGKGKKQTQNAPYCNAQRREGWTPGTSGVKNSHTVNGEKREGKKKGTYICLSGPAVNSSDQGRRVETSPCGLWQVVAFFSIRLQKVFDGTGEFPKIPRLVKQIHLVVFVPHFFRQTAGPGLDFVEAELVLVVPRLTHVYCLVSWQSTRPSPRVPCDEHDEAAVLNVLKHVVAILTGFYYFVFIEMLVKPMDGLLWSIIPASIHPSLPGCI